MTFTTVTDARDYISRTWGDWLSNSGLSYAQVEYLCEFLGERLWRDQLPLDAEGEIDESFMAAEIQRVLGSDFYAAVRDDQIVAWTTAEDDGEAQIWHRGYPGTDLVVLDLAPADEAPRVGAHVVVDEDGVAELGDAAPTIYEAQLYWDTQDPDNAGWWLRYRDDRGVEDGCAIDGAEDASVEDLARAVNECLSSSDRGIIRVYRGEHVGGEINIADDHVEWCGW